MPDSTAGAHSSRDDSPASSANDGKQAFVRRVSNLMEECGQPCIAGRIVGWLLVSEPAEQSFGDLLETTDASKGSISTMTRRLEQDGLVERVTRAGDRQTYFRLRPCAWRTVLRRRMTLMRDFAGIAERGMEQMANEPPSVRHRLEEMHDFCAFIAEKMPALLDEYEASARCSSESA